MPQFDFSSLPRWVFAFAALIVAVSAGYGMFYADCTTQIFGLSFGKNRTCAETDADLVARVAAVETNNKSLEEQISTLQSLSGRLEAIETESKSFRPQIGTVGKLAGRVEAVEAENKNLRSEFDTLGMKRRGEKGGFITNHGHGDIVGCPEGWFVSAISAPGGVGGKFATDGINRIEYRCSPVVK